MRLLILSAASLFVLFQSSAARAEDTEDTGPSKERAPSSSSWHPNVPLVVAGISAAGSAYGLSAWVASRRCTFGDDFCEQHAKDLFVPFVGPMIHAANLSAQPLGRESDLIVDPIHLVFGNRGWRYFEVGLLALDSLAQVGGVCLAMYGLLQHDSKNTKNNANKAAKAARLSVQPVIGFSQLGVWGEF